MTRGVKWAHAVAVLITVAFVVIGALCFPTAIVRLWFAVRDLGLSIAFYFTELLGFSGVITPTVTDPVTLPDWSLLPNPVAPDPSLPPSAIPDNWTIFKTRFAAFGSALITKSNFIAYVYTVGNMLYNVCMFFVFILPFLILFAVLIRRRLLSPNNDYDHESRPLRLWKRVRARLVLPVCLAVRGWFGFIRDNNVYRWLWLTLWLLHFNLATIVLSFFAYYLYFVASFDVLSLYYQFYKLAIDLLPMIRFLPAWVWILMPLLIVERWARRHGIRVLWAHEFQNRAFIERLPIVTMVCANMGAGKTTLLTDMALSQAAMFRDQAFELMRELWVAFPAFPFLKFERELRDAMDAHEVYTLASTRQWVRRCAEVFYSDMTQANCFGYDFEHYPLEYNDGLTVSDLFAVLEDYAQLYFIYVIDTSLTVSNYSIREDDVLADSGNLPVWNSDFFGRDPNDAAATSRHSHIVDFDALRLGKRMLADNPTIGSFEFGLVNLTEIGKERGNMVENADKAKDDECANPKNDLFNAFLKLIRHLSTVRHVPFVKFLTDEQRPESWGKDARDLCTITHIREKTAPRLARPFFFYREMLFDLVVPRWQRFYTRFRQNRADNTLLMHALNAAVSAFARHVLKQRNVYGYHLLNVETERGTQDGTLSQHRYFISHKKTYSDRYATDCYASIFEDATLRSSVGIADLPEYETTVATFDDLKNHHAYFLEIIEKFRDGGESVPSESAPDTAALAALSERLTDPAYLKKVDDLLKLREKRQKLLDRAAEDPAFWDLLQNLS